MAMTKEERDTKNFIVEYLAKEGYPTYARLFNQYHLHLTSSPKVIGYMEPDKGTITINRNLDEDQFSVIIRHEILHYYLEHQQRLLDHLARLKGLDPDQLDDIALKDLKNELYSDSTFNIAGDYEISNRGYTEEDKKNVRAILLNGEKLKGLVTEDDHPEWVNYSVEEMYDELKKQMNDEQKDMKDDLDDSDNENDGDPGPTSSDKDKENPQPPQGTKKGKSQGGNNKSSTIIYGKLIDSKTFVDQDGNPVTFG